MPISRRYLLRRRRRLYVVFFLLLLAALCALFWRQREVIPELRPFDVLIWRTDIERLVSMSLEEYLVGVVAAEMPASFEPEALKAQAVAARTYAYRRIVNDERMQEFSSAHLTTDFRSGQAWISTSEMKARWGLGGYLVNRHRIVEAIKDTEGLVAFYEGEPILAVYHSTSGGRTENSEHYWSSALPYLRSVPDPYSANSPHHYSEVAFDRDRFFQQMGTEPTTDIAVVRRYPSGRVDVLRVGDLWFSGREVRQRLGLPSTWFRVEVSEQISFFVWGYGHGVGMSQYGAQGMALQGWSFQQILAYYYQGIVLQQVY